MSDGTTDSVYGTALEYIARGWAVIPVHGIADVDWARCTCGRAPCGRDNETAGKHPVRKGWQAGPAMSAADAYATWEEDGPDWNVGIRTGPISGFWALDVDPKSGGNESLTALEREHGELPRTRVHWTGSGGRHLLFSLPDFPVTNSQRSRRLPPGIDVRGDGGMVIAPPSVSGIGRYLFTNESEIVAAPDWLLDLIRPTTVLPEQPDAVVVEDLPATDDLDEYTRARVQRYAERVVAAEVASYVDASAGHGNERLFLAACNALEIAQSPWNGVTVSGVHRALSEATWERSQRMPGHGQPPTEFEATFNSARSRVVGKGRPLPPEPEGGGAGTAFDPPVGGDPVSDAGSPDGTHEFDRLMAQESSAAGRLERLLLNRSQVDDQEAPVPLIDRVIDAKTTVVLSGQFGTFKSFVLLGWLASIATGRSWMGHRVITQGPVLLVAAEGASGIKLRLAAWEKEHKQRIPDDAFHVIAGSVNIADPDQARAVAEIAKRIGAVAVGFDTLTRCSGDLDENSNTDMKKVVHFAEKLSEYCGGLTTVFAHHAGHSGIRSRGASAIEDNADCVWISRLTTGNESRDPSKPRMLEQRKVKDGEPLEPFAISLDLVPETGSGVLVAVDQAGNRIAMAGEVNPFGPAVDVEQVRARWESETTEEAAVILGVFTEVFGEYPDGMTRAEVKTVVFDRTKGRDAWHSGRNFRSKFAKGWGRLLKRGILEEGARSRFYVVPVEDRIDRTVPHVTPG